MLGASPAFAADYRRTADRRSAAGLSSPSQFGGWYIRGDLDYHWSSIPRRRLHHLRRRPAADCRCRAPAASTAASLNGAFSLGVGVGYQINNYLRTDLTVDYLFDSDFDGSTTGVCGGVACASSDTSSYSAWLLLANAYADLGTYYGFTPYVGAGIGGAHVKWDDLRQHDRRRHHRA